MNGRGALRIGEEDKSKEESGELTFSHARCLLMRVIAVYTKGGLIVPNSVRCVPRLSNADYCIVRMESSNEYRVERKQHAESSSVGSVSSPQDCRSKNGTKINSDRPAFMSLTAKRRTATSTRYLRISGGAPG